MLFGARGRRCPAQRALKEARIPKYWLASWSPFDMNCQIIVDNLR